MRKAEQEAVLAMMHRINQAWLDGRLEDLGPMVHPQIVMVLPGFAGRIEGREEFLGGFKDFCENAKVHDFSVHNQQADIAGGTAVVTFRYEMVYERSGERYRSRGRDLWVFQSEESGWKAVWRMMFDAEEEAERD
ncbi:MAG: nuclear transport factor 2 family protein [Alphaproteobacteria bacterium]|nr:nuclear transport factor 2 family protein [Alphaproteobacteria bacterium]